MTNDIFEFIFTCISLNVYSSYGWRGYLVEVTGRWRIAVVLAAF